MTSINDMDEFIVFDTETTGVDRENDRIVTAYVGLMNRAGQLLRSKSWIIDPGVEIPEGAANVHGVTTERAQAEGAQPSVAIPEIISLLQGRIARGTPISAYNISYDTTIVDRESRRYGGPGLDITDMLAIDPYVIDKAIDKYRRGKRKLEITAAFYGIELIGAHDAEADAVATGRLAWAVLGKLPTNTTLEQLTRDQVRWAAEQAEGLQRYFRSDKNPNGADPTSVVDGRWPMAPFDAELAA